MRDEKDLFLEEIVDCIVFQNWNLTVTIVENFMEDGRETYRAHASNQSEWAFTSQLHLSASIAIRDLYDVMVENNSISSV